MSKGKNIISKRKSGDTRIRTAAYLRVSTDKQDFDRQVEGIKNWFEANKHTHVAVTQQYTDYNKSGGGFSRESYNRMVQHATMGQFSQIVSYGMDRMGREVSETINSVKALKKAGVVYHDCEMNLTYGEKPETDFIMHQMWAFAEMQLVQIKRRVQDKMNDKKKALAKFGCRLGSAGILDRWVPSPVPCRADKLGVAVKPSESKRDFFKKCWKEGVTVRDMAGLFRYPVNEKCRKCKGNPPKDSAVKRVMAQKCRCGRMPTEKTIHMNRVKLDLPQRKPHAFGMARHELLPEEYKVDFGTFDDPAGLKKGKEES
jgi:DNA invertase Pin-like site-specific DNA recombinase